jgi:hypothetical protein
VALRAEQAQRLFGAVIGRNRESRAG